MRAVLNRWALALAGVALALAIAPAVRADRLSGTVRYQDKVHSEVDGTVIDEPMRPVRYVVLDFVRASDPGTVLGQTTTNTAGEFSSPTIGNHDDILILVKAGGTHQGQTAVVRDQGPDGGAIQTYQSQPFDLSGGAVAGATIDITADAIAGAFNIYDKLIRGHDFVRNELYATPPAAASFDLVVRWERGADSDGVFPPGSYYTIVGDVHLINLLGDHTVDCDGFDDSVILHEYGHLVAHLYSRDDSPGGPHYLGDAHDLRLAYSEGWANYFSCAVRGTPFYIDTVADQNFNLIFEIETPSVPGVPGLPVTGPENQLAVSALFWDLQAADIQVAHGAIDTPIEALWDVIRRYLPSDGVVDVTLEDVWDGYFESAVTPAYGTSGANKPTLIELIKARDIPYHEDDHQPNHSADQATSITVDGSELHGTHYYDRTGDGLGHNDEDWYTFFVTAGETYTIETFDLNPSGDTRIQLYDNNENLLTSNEDIGPGNRASRIIHTFAQGGRHYVRVSRATKPLPTVEPGPIPPPERGAYANYGRYAIRVETGGQPEAPTVVAISPQDGATGVPVGTTIVATFSHDVQLGSVTTDSFTLAAEGTPVPGTVSLNAPRTVATFTPNSNLMHSTRYTVHLTDDIEDAGGRALEPFTSTFTTAESTAPPDAPVPRVPRAQIAAGDGYVEVEWVYPTAHHDGVIVALGRSRFPTIHTVEENGETVLRVANGSEVYRGNTDTHLTIPTANGQRAFVRIWTFIGTRTSSPYQLATRAARGGRGIIDRFDDGDPDEDPGTDPRPGPPTLPRPERFQVVAGDGFVDIEFVKAAGDFDGVIVAVGSSRFPVLRQVVRDGELDLAVSGGTRVYEGSDRVRFRLPTSNGARRFACVWTFRGTDYSRPLFAATRAARGGRGITERNSFYVDFEEPETLGQN